jgi:hypothetical protein
MSGRDAAAAIAAPGATGDRPCKPAGTSGIQMMSRESSCRVEDERTDLKLIGRSGAQKPGIPHRRDERQETQMLIAALSLAAIGIIILISILMKLLGFENALSQYFRQN